MRYDLIIIGGGPGGYTAAIHGAKSGLKVALVEKENVGGTCLNVGCIPTKALISSAAAFDELEAMRNSGFSVGEVGFDWQKIQDKKNQTVSQLTNGVRGLLRQNKVDVYDGNAQLQGADTVLVGDEVLNTDHVIIATGSKPRLVPGFPESVSTSREALSFDQIPERLLVVGGGVIGIEMAYVYHQFGSDVTVVEMADHILGRMDGDVIETATQSLIARGIKIKTSMGVSKIEETDAGTYKAVLQDGSQVEADRVLVSIGRQSVLPEMTGLNLRMNRGAIHVDESMQTSVRGVYAIGDVTGKAMLAHVASHQGIVAVNNILGHAEKMQYAAIPSCVYSKPEIGCVGLTEDEAKAKYGEVTVSVFPLSYNGKAMASGHMEGFAKIISENTYQQVVGFHMIGESATELVAEATLAMSMEATIDEITATVHAHPSVAEAVLEASMGVNGKAIHMFETRKIGG